MVSGASGPRGGAAERFPVGRLAPSPTGRLHLGHARTFLIAWWHVRRRSGRVVMRLEDLDGPRVAPGMADAALRDLEWLGLDWDGPVVVQSERLPEINAAVARLVDLGLAYPCVCSRTDIRLAQSAPQAGAPESRYPGTCRDRFASLAEAEQITGKPAGLRFRAPAGSVRIEDGFAPVLEMDVAADVGDFLIARRDGAPAYQLAVVVDDDAQGVTEVLRGDDLLPSTARQHLLQQALGLAAPAWYHVPLVVDGAGRRLAKRAGDLSLEELRARGVDPRAIVAWAARTSGVPATGLATAAEITPHFDLARLPSRPVALTTTEVATLFDGR